ncbi:hypothetical protein HDV00_009969 [Rhizophlyctis rosea]|nr:hypothetical protein HDV00_009969 [Rhizophlyctis rosea]
MFTTTKRRSNIPRPSSVRRLSVAFLALIVVAFTLYSYGATRDDGSKAALRDDLRTTFDTVLQGGAGAGGNLTTTPANIVDAARLASRLASLDANRNVSHTSIPLILHQTYKTTDVRNWPDNVVEGVSSWIAGCVGRWAEHGEKQTHVAYFMWDDEGMDQAVELLRPKLHPVYSRLPVPVLKADTFRIFTVHAFGGIYADADTRPLRHPSTWVGPEDLTSWKDPHQGTVYYPDQSIGLIVGIECDTPEGGDRYWRMGYAHSLELLNWAFAGRASHPTLDTMLNSIAAAAEALLERERSVSTGHARGKKVGPEWDPLEVTGPYRLTDVVVDYIKEGGARWNAFSGLEDGGRSKGFRDVLVLPITGFR